MEREDKNKSILTTVTTIIGFLISCAAIGVWITAMWDKVPKPPSKMELALVFAFGLLLVWFKEEALALTLQYIKKKLGLIKSDKRL